MKPTQIRMLMAALVLTGCASSIIPSQDETSTKLSSKSTGLIEGSTFPYHPLVYHMDLSILAYQVYGQSLVWPYDPYYEELDANKGARDGLMKRIADWAAQTGKKQIDSKPGIAGYRGPGSLNGFPNNGGHDPIVYRYGYINPWSNALNNAAGKWTEYLTPKSITGRIKSVQVCFRPAGGQDSEVSTSTIRARSKVGTEAATDYLLAFEGGTGDKGERLQPASQSVMGVILVRTKPDERYDIHIAFRGSRSGSAGRAVLEALSDAKASGNPDWITDLGYNRLGADQGIAHVSTKGMVHRGFAKSMESIFPSLFRCLESAAKLKKDKKPDNIYVTGHSLGGALAQAFTSSVLLGNQYGPRGSGKRMPVALRQWPWKSIKLISFSAPRIGDATFAKELTEVHLQSEFFTSPVNPVDVNALRPNDASILSRLLTTSRPVGFRVLHSKDPITTEKGAGGKHVGKTVYVNKPKFTDVVSPPDFSAHEQKVIRDHMLKNLGMSDIPKVAMQYRSMSEINPKRDRSERGSIEEVRQLANSWKEYNIKNDIWFDRDQIEADLLLRSRLRQGR